MNFSPDLSGIAVTTHGIEGNLRFLDFHSDEILRHLSCSPEIPQAVLIVRGGGTDLNHVLDLVRQSRSARVWSIEAVQLKDRWDIFVQSNMDVRRTVLLLERAPDRLAELLHFFVDKPTDILAPITTRFMCGQGLFITTIPKSGTHLLVRLLEEFGLKRGKAPLPPLAAGTWYAPIVDQFHLSAQAIFEKFAFQSHGGHANPLFFTPTLFLYRNPLAILVSMARYLGEQGNNALNHLFESYSMDRRIDELIDSYLLGKFSSRIGYYLSWLDLPNVIPIAFEELVGPKGHGSVEAQHRLIWSLQLKLQIPGSPAGYAEKIHSEDTPTLRIGTIDSFTEFLQDHHVNTLRALPSDFMTGFGYKLGDHIDPGYLPRHVDRFRTRQLLLPPVPDTSISGDDPAIVASHREFNIVRYKRRFYGLRQSAGEVDMTIGEKALRERYHSDDLAIGSTIEMVRLRIDSLQDSCALRAEIRELGNQLGLSRHDNPTVPPELIANHRGFNLIRYRGRIYGLRQLAGAIDVTMDDDLLFERHSPDDVIIGSSLELVMIQINSVESSRALLGRIDDLVKRLDVHIGLKPVMPTMITSYRQFNIVSYGKQTYGLRQAAGPIDIAIGKEALRTQFAADDVVIESTPKAVIKRIDQIEDARVAASIDRADNDVAAIGGEGPSADKRPPPPSGDTP